MDVFISAPRQEPEVSPIVESSGKVKPRVPDQVSRSLAECVIYETCIIIHESYIVDNYMYKGLPGCVLRRAPRNEIRVGERHPHPTSEGKNHWPRETPVTSGPEGVTGSLEQRNKGQSGSEPTGP